MPLRTFQNENGLLRAMFFKHSLEVRATRRQDQSVGSQHAALASQSRVRQGAAPVESLEQPRQIRQMIVPRKVERLLAHILIKYYRVSATRYND